MRGEHVAAGRPGGGRHAALLCLLVSLLATSCVAVPSSSPVHEGQPLSSGEGNDGSSIRFLPEPPLDGEGPVDIVRGFLYASVSFERNHLVARRHLHPTVAPRWNPAAEVVVYDRPEPLVEGEVDGDDERIVTLQARRVATIDEQGRYLPARPQASYRATFRLRRVDGQWRISDLPDGLLLTRRDLAHSFRPVNLFYLDPDREILVPDRVYLPLRPPGLATVMTQALLRGPTDWLGPAVQTAFPAGTRLASSPIVLDPQGVVTGDLTSPVRLLPASARRDLVAQLVWTLRQLPEVDGVRVNAEGSTLDVPGAPSVHVRGAWRSYDPSAPLPRTTAYLVRGGRLASLRSGDLVSHPRPLGEPALRWPAVSLDGEMVAALSPFADALRVGRLDPPEPLGTRLRGQDFTTPSWDRWGNVWTAGRPQGSSSQVWAVGRHGQPRRVEAALGDADVLALRVARDGTRVALATTSAGVDELQVGRIVRGDSLHIEALHKVTGSLTEVQDVAWAGPDRLAVLGRTRTGPTQVWLMDVDGTRLTSRGSVPGMVSIAAAPEALGSRTRPLLVGTGQGLVFQNAAGTSWQRVTDGRDPAYPG